jgi:hypothetical protein
MGFSVLQGIDADYWEIGCSGRDEKTLRNLLKLSILSGVNVTVLFCFLTAIFYIHEIRKRKVFAVYSTTQNINMFIRSGEQLILVDPVKDIFYFLQYNSRSQGALYVNTFLPILGLQETK